MKILLSVSVTVCALVTGCLPPGAPGVVVTPGYHRPYGYAYPYGYRSSSYRPYGYRSSTYHPYDRRDVVVVNRHAPTVRHTVVGRPPFPGARWVNGRWIR
jgi:hypothetical protein